MELISNEYYSLSELLKTDNRKIIIPDFQRDYCWGDKTHGEKNIDIVSGFLDTLFEEYESKSENVLLGKIDVYESPKNHIYLTDGQQRLTTLYLIIGMLHKAIQNGEIKTKLKACMISDFEENDDDKEPYLQYAVRESTVFFLRDLVNEYFIKENSIKVSEIKSQPWYFSEYNLDPSIISMLNAIEIIDRKLNTNRDINVSGLSEFVINSIKIQYYDVKDKHHGEERFVIINTTGKSLTVSENIKPILIGNVENKEFAQKWESRESWFWEKRDKLKENISDFGVNQFLIWCFQIIDRQDDVDIIKKAKELLKNKNNEVYLIKIQAYFDALHLLLEYLKDDKIQKQFKFINDAKEVKTIIDIRNLSKEKLQNIILPLLAFISKYGNNKKASYQFLRRLRKNYFDQKWNERNCNYVDWRYVLQIIEKSSSEYHVLQYPTNEESIVVIKNISLNVWFNVEEKLKSRMSDNKDLLEEFEDHIDFMGDLSFLLQTSNANNNLDEIFTLNERLTYNFEKLQTIYENYQSTIDLIRSEVSANFNPLLANMFRLFRLFIGCNKVGHIYRTSWDFEGVLFSTLNRNHLTKVEFMNLLNSNNLLEYCTTYVKNCIIQEEIFDLTNFKVDKFIKSWLTLKVFYANYNNILLDFYDGYGTGVAAYLNKDINKLIDYVDFSLGNSICGFGVCSGGGGGNYIHTTRNDLWCNINIIDTPFSSIEYNKDNRNIEQVIDNQKVIDDIIRIINV
jgi:hypothetical protein